MMRIGPRELLFLIVLASVPVASWFFVFEPRNRDISEARAEIDSMQGTLAQLNDLLLATKPNLQQLDRYRTMSTCLLSSRPNLATASLCSVQCLMCSSEAQ